MQTQDYTYACWFKANNLQNGAFIALGEDGDSDQYLGVESNKLKGLSYYEPLPWNLNGRDYFLGTTNLETEKWYFAALVRDSSSGELTLYLDGNNDGKTTLTLPDVAYYGDENQKISFGIIR